jgi:hypothetical protein
MDKRLILFQMVDLLCLTKCTVLLFNFLLNAQVADALMKHATDKQFDENPPVPDNIAALAKEAEDEMKIDAKVMETGSARRR